MLDLLNSLSCPRKLQCKNAFFKEKIETDALAERN
jgi:hypothetical protein